MRAIHGGFCRVAPGRGGNALVECHHNVAADLALNSKARFGREQEPAAVDVTLEPRAFLGQRAGVRQGEDLVAAGIRQHGAVPVHEPVNTAKPTEHLHARAQHQVIGVGQQHGEAGCTQRIHLLRLDRGLCSYGHEHRRNHRAMPGLEGRSARARSGSLGRKGEIQTRHPSPTAWLPP